MIERINDNAFKIDLPGEYNVSTSFNVSDLSTFNCAGDNSRTNPLEERGNDENQRALQIPSGSITRSKKA